MGLRFSLTCRLSCDDKYSFRSMPVINFKCHDAGGLVDPVVFPTTTIIHSSLCRWRIISFTTPEGSLILSSPIRQQLLIPVYTDDKILSFAAPEGSLRSWFFMQEQEDVFINTRRHHVCVVCVNVYLKGMHALTWLHILLRCDDKSKYTHPCYSTCMHEDHALTH